MAEKKTFILTGVLSFPSLLEPAVSVDEQGNAKKQYETQLIISKTFDMTEFNKVVEELIVEHNGKKPRAGIRLPVRDGSEKTHLAGFSDQVVFITARSKQKPPVVDNRKVGITDEALVFGGTNAKVAVNLFWYDKGISRGVGCGLQACQVLGGGEPFGNVADPDQLFEEEDEFIPGPTAGASSGW